jgi:hypothetical protein
MRLYKLKAFARFQRRERIADRALGKAVRSAEMGLVDADLGGGLIKQRVARPGQGKSGGYRTLIAYRRGDRAVFLYGFAKSDQASVDADQLAYWRQIGRVYLGLDDESIEAAITIDELMEMGNDDEA